MFPPTATPGAATSSPLSCIRQLFQPLADVGAVVAIDLHQPHVHQQRQAQRLLSWDGGGGAFDHLALADDFDTGIADVALIHERQPYASHAIEGNRALVAEPANSGAQAD